MTDPLNTLRPRNPLNAETQIPWYTTNSNFNLSQFECVTRDTERSEILDLVAFGGVTISAETVIQYDIETVYYMR